jgi:hypothetical protein
LSAITVRSQAIAKELPMPAAAPFTALMKGLGASLIAISTGLYSSSICCCTSGGTPSARSAPALKPRPSPVSTTTRTAASSLAQRTAASSSRRIWPLKAFITAGRFSVISATPSSTA